MKNKFSFLSCASVAMLLASSACAADAVSFSQQVPGGATAVVFGGGKQALLIETICVTGGFGLQGTQPLSASNFGGLPVPGREESCITNLGIVIPKGASITADNTFTQIDATSTVVIAGVFVKN